ncbi:hypothetical protein BSKO_10063 [Bryopsis sp. KO-2023]|nr:hypothetical protein BSKO_10063 [Bryopsis sp. KO-2023]
MQSHACRHVVSEFLKDLHPDYSPPTIKGVIPDEIAVAHGRRVIPKLVDALKLPELPDEGRAHCLRIFNALMPNQEMKAEAIALDVAPSLMKHMTSDTLEVVTLCCQAVETICKVLPGRLAVVKAGGIQTLTSTLTKAPTYTTAAFEQLCRFKDGQQAVLQSTSQVIPALVALINDEATALEASRDGASTLSNLTSTDSGIMLALEAKVPQCMVALVKRVAEGSSQQEEIGAVIMDICAECFQRMSRHELGKVSIRENHGIDALASVLSKCVSTVKKATSALMGISIDIEGKKAVMDVCFEPLMELIKHEEQDIVDNVRATILNCCENPEASMKVRAVMSPAEREFFLGPLPVHSVGATKFMKEVDLVGTTSSSDETFQSMEV